MTPTKPYLQHLTSSEDLITNYQETRSGFVALALEKNRRATPFIEEARTLKLFASQAKNPTDLLEITDIQPALITAAGLSDKAIKYLEIQDKIDAIQGLIKNFLEPAGSNFIEELVFRFLLTRGELKGGIDPAGADEHWKTARTALKRIVSAFSHRELKPHTFFIGSAIEKNMAREIWHQLEAGVLENTANLTNEQQMVSICRWICHL